MVNSIYRIYINKIYDYICINKYAYMYDYDYNKKVNKKSGAWKQYKSVITFV